MDVYYFFGNTPNRLVNRIIDPAMVSALTPAAFFSFCNQKIAFSLSTIAILAWQPDEIIIANVKVLAGI